MHFNIFVSEAKPAMNKCTVIGILGNRKRFCSTCGCLLPLISSLTRHHKPPTLPSVAPKIKTSRS